VRRVLASGVVLLVLVATGSLAGGGYLAVRDLQHGVDRLQQATAAIGGNPEAWSPARIGDARVAQEQASREIAGASSRLRANLLVRAGLLLPGAREQVRTTLDLAAASEDASAAAGDLIQIAQRYQAMRLAGGPSGPKLIDALVSFAPFSADAQQRIDHAIGALQGDARRPLLPPLAGQLRTALARLNAAKDAVALLSGVAAYVPAAAGKTGPRTYLLLFMNPSELRPAGGFVGAFGTITVNDGTPTAISVRSSTELDTLSKTRFPIPRALGARLSFPNSSLDLADAGWDPDYPSSARLSEQIYQAATGQSVDGTIAFDPYALAALLRVTGAVDVAPYGTFDDQNLFTKLNSIVNERRDPSSGKKALGPIAQAILQRMVQAPADSWMQAIAASRDEAGARHVLLFMHDATLSAATRTAGYDGSIVPAADGKDYLMVVDGNIGGTKGDSYVKKQMHGKVEVSPQGFARHELILSYNYPTGISDPAIPKGQDTAYRDYLRFYIPETSTLLAYYQTYDGGEQRKGAVEEVSIEHGKRVIGTYFRLPAGHSTELHLVFQGPVQAEGRYELYMQKQAGLPARPADFLVSFPGGLTRRLLSGDRDEQLVVQW
jgi:Protein of unknown function (DUF4012)